jgi:hypothetical protein
MTMAAARIRARSSASRRNRIRVTASCFRWCTRPFNSTRPHQRDKFLEQMRRRSSILAVTLKVSDAVKLKHPSQQRRFWHNLTENDTGTGSSSMAQKNWHSSWHSSDSTGADSNATERKSPTRSCCRTKVSGHCRTLGSDLPHLLHILPPPLNAVSKHGFALRLDDSVEQPPHRDHELCFGVLAGLS